MTMSRLASSGLKLRFWLVCATAGVLHGGCHGSSNGPEAGADGSADVPQNTTTGVVTTTLTGTGIVTVTTTGTTTQALTSTVTTTKAGLDAGQPDSGGLGMADAAATSDSSTCVDPLVVTNDITHGRLHVENNTLRLEFGYSTSSATHQNQSGGNLYLYVDKRYSTTLNVISVWNGGSGDTSAYASGAGGIGSTQLYAIDDLSQLVSGTYADAIGDNDLDGVSLAAPTMTTAGNGSVVLVFGFGVQNRQSGTPVRWYEISKTWTISCGGRIALRHDWNIVRTGYFSEPATRQQVNTAWTTISRFGHMWDEPPSGPPGSSSRTNPADQWWDWTPNPSSVGQCSGDGAGLDAVHSDYVRFHGGLACDFWFWPDNGGLGYEGLGLYAVGYQAFGGSFNASVLEICHHNRTSIGDGADAYNVMPTAWWGGDGATADRYKKLAAGIRWTDTYQMEVRPTGQTLPQ